MTYKQNKVERFTYGLTFDGVKNIWTHINDKMILHNNPTLYLINGFYF